MLAIDLDIGDVVLKDGGDVDLTAQSEMGSKHDDDQAMAWPSGGDVAS